MLEDMELILYTLRSSQGTLIITYENTPPNKITISKAELIGLIAIRELTNQIFLQLSLEGVFNRQK